MNFLMPWEKAKQDNTVEVENLISSNGQCQDDLG